MNKLYRKLKNTLLFGVLKSEEQMPSIRDMAFELGINPNTVKKAYSILENKGVIITISTKGTYISNNTKQIVQNKINDKIKEIQDIIIELEKLGLTKDKIIEMVKKS